MKKQFQVKSFKSLQYDQPQKLQKIKSVAYLKKNSLITGQYDKLFQKPSEDIAQEYLTNPFMKARVDSFIKTKEKECQQMERSHRINKTVDGQNQQNQVTLRQLLSKKILEEKSVVDELKNQITKLKMKRKTSINNKKQK